MFCQKMKIISIKNFVLFLINLVKSLIITFVVVMVIMNNYFCDTELNETFVDIMYYINLSFQMILRRNKENKIIFHHIMHHSNLLTK